MADEKRLIYAEDAIKWIKESKVPETGAFTKGINKGLDIALSTLGNNEVLPTVDAIPVVHGRWVKDEEASKNHIEYIYVCSACENCEAWGASEKTNYCPYCGAKMDGDGNG